MKFYTKRGMMNYIKKSNNGFNIMYGTKRLKDDFDLGLEVVKRTGCAISLLSERLRDNEIIAETAIQQNPNAIEYISDRLKNDKKLVLQTLEKDGTTLRYVENLQDDIEAVYVAMSQNIYAYKFASKRLQNAMDHGLWKDEMKMIMEIHENPEKFADIPPHYFIDGNFNTGGNPSESVLDYAMQTVQHKLLQMPNTEENKKYKTKIYKMMEKTINDNFDEWKKQGDWKDCVYDDVKNCLNKRIDKSGIKSSLNMSEAGLDNSENDM